MLNLNPQNSSLWPLLILFLGLTLTGTAWHYTSVIGDEKAITEFNLHAQDASRDVQERIKVYFGILRSAGSFFAGADSVTRTEWKRYVELLRLKESYPGIEGMGVIRCITREQKEKFENILRRENGSGHAGNTGYVIHPSGIRETYYPVEYIEPPLDHLNLPGLDHGAYPEGLKMLESARDSGTVTISRKLPYAKGSDRNPPILFLYPIYNKGLPSNTVDERQKAIWGFVYARMNLEKLFHDAISPSVIQEIYFEAFDGGDSGREIPSLGKAHLIYDTDPGDIPRALDASFKPRHQINKKVGVDGAVWFFYSASRSGGMIERRDNTPLLILFAGSLLSVCASVIAFIRGRQKQLIHCHAYYDYLTGLPNRILLQDRFRQVLATARRDKVRMALMFVDLDEFKPVNDIFGHTVGDLLLKEAAQRIQGCLRESDTAARIGGDEFIVLLPAIGAGQDAMAVAEKIRQALNQPFELAGRSLFVSSSIGIAIYPEHGGEEETLLKNADAAMYLAKESGRNTVRFFSAMQQQ